MSASTVATVGFLCAVTFFFSFFSVPIRFGSLRLVLIGAQTAGLLFAPAEAEVVGLVAGLTRLSHGPSGDRYFGVVAPVLWTSAGSAARIAILRFTHDDLLAYGSVPLLVTVLNWTLTGLEFRLITAESMLGVLRRNFDLSWASAFAYFALCSVLIAGVLDSSPRGYLLAAFAAYLSTTLTVSISERRVRLALEQHIRDNERYLAYVRAAEGLIHRLRNESALAKGYVEEIIGSRISAPNRKRAAIAKEALDASLDALNRLGSAFAVGVTKSNSPVNINQLLTTSMDVVRPGAREKKIELVEKRGYRPVWIDGDAHLLRDVLENLLLNAIDAAPKAGRITAAVQRKKECVEIRVADNGPGIPEEMRDRLFEPHFTTKPNGTGMGLFTSYGVVREHRGKLLYEGSPEGAVFVVQLPLSPTTSMGAAVTEPSAPQVALASTKR